MIFSFFFIAPGLLLRLLCLIFGVAFPAASGFAAGARSGRASASESRLGRSFLEGRLRFWIAGLDFSIRERRAECLMVRLSFLVVLKRLRTFEFEAVERLLVRRPTVGALNSQHSDISNAKHPRHTIRFSGTIV